MLTKGKILSVKGVAILLVNNDRALDRVYFVIMTFSLGKLSLQSTKGIRSKWTSAVATLAAVATLSTALLPVAEARVFHGYWIDGRIEQTFHRLGGVKHFGVATTPESVSQYNGRFQHFRNNASIYWHANVDNGIAHAVEGRIRDKWSSLGWERSTLGYPLTDELTTPDGKGRFNHFRGGSIYWTPETDAHQIGGAIRDKWEEQGWETGQLGYPETDEVTTPDRVGRFNRFQDGFIYWSPGTGAQIVEKDIFEVWGQNGWEAGRLGYPTSDRYESNGGIKQDFQHGTIQIFPATGQVLEKFDNANYSSYVKVFPLFEAKNVPTTNAAGINREIIQNMDTYFPLPGCPKNLTVGTICTFPSMGGEPGPATVTRIADNGFTLTTSSGHPEGAGRKLNIRFDTVDSPSAISANEVFLNDEIKAQYAGTDKTWIRMIVEAFGDTTSSRVAGPFISDHFGTQVWSELASTLNVEIPRSTNVYGPVSR